MQIVLGSNTKHSEAVKKAWLVKFAEQEFKLNDPSKNFLKSRIQSLVNRYGAFKSELDGIVTAATKSREVVASKEIELSQDQQQQCNKV